MKNNDRNRSDRGLDRCCCGAAAGYFIGYNNRKKTAEAQIGSAEAEATRLVNEAIKTADQKRKEAVLEAKDEAFS